MANFTSVPVDVFSFFKNENIAQGVPPGNFVAGVNDTDNDNNIGPLANLPWPLDHSLSYLDYRCWIEVSLDSGMALHRPLPQTDYAPDTLSSMTVSPLDEKFEENILGTNTTSVGKFTDVVQRMANSLYRFVLRGWGLRAGYKIPIPGLKSVAGVPAIPEEGEGKQWAYNEVVRNCGGVPVYFAQWELHYVVTMPPKEAQSPPPNLGQRMGGDVPPPDAVVSPLSRADMNMSTLRAIGFLGFNRR